MRPLSILALALGVLASLFFAYVSLSDGSRGRGEGTLVTRGPVVRPNRPQGQAEESDTLKAAPIQAKPLAESVAANKRDEIRSGAAHIGFIRGTVVDPGGKPLEGAKLSLIHLAEGALWAGNGLSLMGDARSAQALAKTTSDVDGKFHFGGIKPGGNWGLSVTHRDFAPQVNGPITVPDRGGKEELVKLQRGDNLTGLVVDALLEVPVEGALLTLVNPMGAYLPSTRKSKGEQVTRSDADGKFIFKNISGVQRTLVIEAEGFATQVLANFTGGAATGGGFGDGAVGLASDGERKPQMIRLEPGQDISGVVLAPDRSPVEGVQLTAVNQIGRFGSRGEAISLSDGTFTLKDLGPGAFSITSASEKFQTVSKQGVQAGSSNVEINLISFGSVAGTVVDAKTGEPLTNFSCRVRNEHPSNPSWGVVVKRANFRDRKDGSFALEGIREGRYVMEVQSRGYASSFSDPFRVTQGADTSSIQVKATRGSVIMGRVLDASSGAPLVGALVTSNDNNFIDNEFMKFLGGMSASATSKKTETTDADGSFRMELMTPDTYQIRVAKQGYTSIVLNGVNVRDVDERTLPDFRLPRGATITGTIYDEQGTGVAGASVILSPDDPALYSDQLQVRADANGAFSFKNVRQGAYKLQSTRPQRPGANPFAGAVDMQNSRREVDVSEGQSYTFDIRFQSKDKGGGGF